MKRIFMLVLMLTAVLSFTACGGAEKGEVSEKTYAASHVHLYPYSDPLFFDSDSFAFTVKGTDCEMTYTLTREETIDGITCTEISKYRYAGSIKEENGNMVFTATECYRLVELSGQNAEAFREKKIENLNKTLADIQGNESESKRKEIENDIKVYTGEEIEANEELSDGPTASFKLDGSARISEITLDGYYCRYTFEYGENGKLVRSAECDLDDGTKYEAEYRDDGTPYGFKYTNGKSGETIEFYCDENGIGVVTGEASAA